MEYLPVVVAGALIRAIPNLVTPYPIGFDTMYYITQILDWRNCIANPNLLLETPLHFLVIFPIFPFASWNKREGSQSFQNSVNELSSALYLPFNIDGQSEDSFERVARAL